ncbi:TPA: LLM class flavin-dependent oxidoreductase [Candidatus Galligastranaerophilus faecipullorum]|nr:LLM class flavin-dependent oxidoreductase [Candidatus Galligastranaerophilus faecipullorum]
MSTRDDIKSLIFKEGQTINSVAKELSRISGKEITPNNLSLKLARDTLRYKEAKAIAEILGYELEFRKR